LNITFCKRQTTRPFHHPATHREREEQQEKVTDLVVTCCWEWAFGRSFAAEPPSVAGGNSGDVWLNLRFAGRETISHRKIKGV